MEPGTDYVDMGARKYDPTLGRFISSDPVLETTSPQQLGGYTYAADNPTTSSDPTGLCAVEYGSDRCYVPPPPPSPSPSQATTTTTASTVNYGNLANVNFAQLARSFAGMNFANFANTNYANVPNIDYANLPSAAEMKGIQAGVQYAQGVQRQQALERSAPGLWSDVTSFVSRHRVVIGIGLGLLAIATGGAGLVLGVAALTGAATVSAGWTAGLAIAAVATGAGAGYADEPDCDCGNQTACFGRDLGWTGAAMGLPAAFTSGGAALGLIAVADTSALNVAGLALSAGAFQAGAFGTTVDISSALTDDGKG